MESAKTEDEMLQMFFDGELAPEEEASVRRTLESSPEGMAQLREWERLREAMQNVSAEWSGDIDSDALFARIEAEIEAPVIPIERAADAKPFVREAPAAAPNWRVWGTLAAAAAIFLAVVVWPKEQANPPSVARGSEVIEVDFGPNTGTIFEVEGTMGESFAVIWIDDEEVGLP